MIGMTIFSMIMIVILDSVANITIARTKSMNRVSLLEELYYFSESLATKIKDGGTLDYEEYWNRQMVGISTGSGHYVTPTWDGNYGAGGQLGAIPNYGSWLYLCRSGDISVDPLNRMWTNGCALTGSLNDSWNPQNGNMQRYGEYMLQYMDYNGDANSDLGDQDGTGGIIGDEDDRDIGDGPEVLSGSTPELYLFDPIQKERTFFRWNYVQDPGNPTTCITSWSGCLGNIQVLKLKWYDIGMNHSWVTTDTGAFDGKIDTWICRPEWNCKWPAIHGYPGNLPSGTWSEWINLFPDYINVKQVQFQIFPRKDPWRAWGAPDNLTTSGFISPFIQPYVRLTLSLGLSWDRRKLIKNDDPTISLATTISLGNSNESD